jgi:hypothetical protein
MFKTAMLASVMLVFASAAVDAASPSTPAYVFSPDGRSIVSAPADKPVVPGLLPANRAAIVNEFATKYPDGLYWCCLGIPVAGPSSGPGEFATAVAFTPATTTQATKITVGVGYISGTNSITVSLYNDNNGTPGTELASGKAGNFGVNGVCCGTGTARIPATTVTAGKQYWVVLSAGGDTFESWDDASADQVHAHTVATNQKNTGWHAYSSIEYPSMEVR